MLLSYVTTLSGEELPALKEEITNNMGDVLRHIADYVLNNAEVIIKSFPMFTAIVGIFVTVKYFMGASKLESCFWGVKKQRIRELILGSLMVFLFLILNLGIDGIFRRNSLEEVLRSLPNLIVTLVVTFVVMSIYSLKETVQAKAMLKYIRGTVTADCIVAFTLVLISSGKYISLNICLVCLAIGAVACGLLIGSVYDRQTQDIEIFLSNLEQIDTEKSTTKYYCYFREDGYCWCGTKREIDQNGNLINMFSWEDIINNKIKVSVVNKLEIAEQINQIQKQAKKNQGSAKQIQKHVSQIQKILNQIENQVEQITELEDQEKLDEFNGLMNQFKEQLKQTKKEINVQEQRIDNLLEKMNDRFQ